MIIDHDRFMEALRNLNLTGNEIKEIDRALEESRGLTEEHPGRGSLYQQPNGQQIFCSRDSGGNLRLWRIGEEIGSGFNRLAARSELNRRRAKFVAVLDQ